MIKLKGFTLIEILVVIALLSVFGTLILTIFTRTLKGSNKAQIIGVIKQNGQAVLENMDKTIRNADDVVCVSNLDPPGPTIVINKNGVYTRYRFIKANPYEANGYIQQDNPAKPPPERTESVLCQDLMDTSATIITDNHLQTGVSITNATLKKEAKSGFKDIITIQFEVAAGEKAPEAIRGQIDAVSFQTTVQLR